MIARRGFLAGSAVLGASLAVPPALHAQSIASAKPILLHDALTADGASFARSASALALAAHDTSRDVAPLFYGSLRKELRGPAKLIAGVSRYADFTVASGIAREFGFTDQLVMTRQDGSRKLSRLARLTWSGESFGPLLRDTALQLAEQDSQFWVFSKPA